MPPPLSITYKDRHWDVAQVDGKIVASDHGKEKWKTNIFEASGAKERYGEVYYWGVSQSPLVEGEFVITQPGGDRNNSVLAVNKSDGKKASLVDEERPNVFKVAIANIGANENVVVTIEYQQIDMKSRTLV